MKKVIRLDFAQLSYQTTEALINSLADFLKTMASIYGLVLSSTELPDRFADWACLQWQRGRLPNGAVKLIEN